MSVCDSYCRGCVYLGYIDGIRNCCNYMLMEDKRRPCPAGKGCTVRTTKRKAKENNGKA